MLAINEPKHIRGDLLNCVNQMRKPKETILVQEKCSLYRISPGDAEYKKIGIFLFTLTKYTLNDSSRSGLTVNDIQSGRLILSTNISPSLTLNANKDNKSFNINCIEEKQRTNLLKFKTQELADSIFMQLSIGVKDSIDAIHHELVADKLILVENSGDKSKSIPFMSFSNGIVSDTLFGKVSISFVQPESDIKADQIDDYTIGLVVIQSDLSSDIVFLKCQIRKDMISVTFEQGVILLKIMDSQEYCYKVISIILI